MVLFHREPDVYLPCKYFFLSAMCLAATELPCLRASDITCMELTAKIAGGVVTLYLHSMQWVVVKPGTTQPIPTRA